MTTPALSSRFDTLEERSKDDDEARSIVGSEVREVIQAYKDMCGPVSAERSANEELCKSLEDGITTQQAMQQLRRALTTDPSYRESWKANIAMAFYDEGSGITINVHENLHEVANKAAERFLQQLEKA